MIAGSGSRTKPSAAIEVRSEGLSLKTKSAPSRAPAASTSVESITRAVWANSRSAVSSGPRSESASTVRNSRRKLLLCTATRSGSENINQSKMRVSRKKNARESKLLVSLVPGFRQASTILGEFLDVDISIRNRGQNLERRRFVMEPRSVLVTGGGGFIGKHLRPLLERQGLNVVSLDYRPAQPGCHPTCYQCDVADSQQVEAIFQTHRFEAVIHLASILPTSSRH